MAATKLGNQRTFPRMYEGTTEVSIPPNSLLTYLQLGKDGPAGPRWLVIGYRNIEEEKLELSQQEYWLPVITAPAHDGASAEIHVPRGCIVSGLQLWNSSLGVAYREVSGPHNFQLGNPEYKGVGNRENTKEPGHDGGGDQAQKDGYTMTGYQMTRDPDGQTAIQLWYRQVL